MRILVSHITRKARGGIAQRGSVIDAAQLAIGRGAACEIHLPDPRVLLDHARIQFRGGGAFVEAQGAGEIRVNGQATGASSLKTGDKIEIGPYEVEIVAPSEGAEFAVTVELTKPFGDDLEQLKSRSSTHLAGVGLTKRQWSWTLAVAVAVLFFVLPLVAFAIKPDVKGADYMAGHKNGALAGWDVVWTSGDISGPHKFFGDNCEACHQQPFRMVRDESCLSCHQGIQHHADTTKFEFAAFGGQLCQSCHKEHNAGLGKAALISEGQQFCSDCHSGLKERAATTELINVRDFAPGQHPQFRPAVMGADGKAVRTALDAEPKPREVSNLKFPHDKHMKKEGVRNPQKGLVKLDCGACHTADAGGVGMLPIRMETHCQDCHSLRFDAKLMNRELPHGQPEQALAVIRDVYAGVALRGEAGDDDAPEAARRRPGRELTQTERVEALAWAERKSVSVADQVIGKSLCGSCHTVTGGDGKWEIAKVNIAWRWMPKAVMFPHSAHQPVSCGTCHDAEKSTESADVLMPAVATCQQCHGGEHATDKVPSSCISCHEFHQPHLGPMRSATGTAGAGGARP